MYLHKASVALLPLIWVQHGEKRLRRPRTTDAAAAADDETEEVVARFSCRHQNTEKTRHYLLPSKCQIGAITANARQLPHTHNGNALLTRRSGQLVCGVYGHYSANITKRSLDRITSSLSDPGVRNVTQHGYTNHLQLLGEKKKKKVVGLVS